MTKFLHATFLLTILSSMALSRAAAADDHTRPISALKCAMKIVVVELFPHLHTKIIMCLYLFVKRLV
jgi:hypothetical protein